MNTLKDDKFDIQTQLIVYNFLGLIPDNEMCNVPANIFEDSKYLLNKEIKNGKKLKSFSNEYSDIKNIKKAVNSELKYRNRSGKNADDQDVNMTIIKKNKNVKVLIHNENSIPVKNAESFSDEYSKKKNTNTLDIYMITPVEDLDKPQFSNLKTFKNSIMAFDHNFNKIYQSQSRGMDDPCHNASLPLETNYFETDKEETNKKKYEFSYMDIKSLTESDIEEMNMSSQNIILKKEINNAIKKLQPELDDTYSRNNQGTSSLEEDISAILRSIGDQVENEHKDIINRSLAELYLNFQNIREWLPTLFQPIISHTNGWKKVAMIILLGQKLVSFLNRNDEYVEDISMLVTEISSFIKENCFSFIINNGGWNALSNQSTLFSSDVQM